MERADSPDHTSPAVHDGTGHRARLRDRLLGAGGGALADHEIVEYLLALALPRRDTKPLAKALLADFGGIGRLMNADPESLRRVPGMGDTSVAAIKIVQAAILRVLGDAVRGRPVLGNWQGLLDYLRADMAHRMNERVRILHLDSRNQLLRDEVMSDGSIDQSAIYVREVIRRALELGSASLIIVHNHPSGDCTPSSQDVAVTRSIAAACKPLGIALHDHIIVGGNDHSSMKSLGLL